MYLVKKVSNLKVMMFALAIAMAGVFGTVSAGDEGCVSCHMGPMALNELLGKIEGHPDVGPMVNTVPTDCAMCHAKGTEMGLMAAIHAKHEGVDCASCHTVDESGAPTGNKTGAKNW